MTHQEPVTEYDSKMAMLRAERSDEIVVEAVGDADVPDEPLTVARRTDPYFGPKLLLDDAQNEQNWMLTAPGPESQLHLWPPDHAEDGLRRGFCDPIEVTAELTDTKQYSICERCGEPIKTMEHEREAAFGLCDS
jgi:hypothetical protein